MLCCTETITPETGKSFFIRKRHHTELTFSIKDAFQVLLAIQHNQKHGLKCINYRLLYSSALVPFSGDGFGTAASMAG